MFMPKKEKIGSDGYSEEIYDAKRNELEELGIAYQPPSPERNSDEEWKSLNDEVSHEAKKIIATLDRLSANAKRLAEKDELHREYLGLVPRVEEAREEIKKTLAEVSDTASFGVVREAGEVLRMGDELEDVLQSESPVQPRSLVRMLIEEFLNAKKYVLGKLRKWLGLQHRYGDPLPPA